jgi:hypothetical protein
MRRTAAVLAACSVLLGTGCLTPPRPVADPIPYLQANQPERIWMATSTDSVSLLVLRPRLLGDTLLGRLESGDVLWVGMHDIRRVEVRRTDPVRTSLLVAGIGAAAIGTLWVLHAGGESDPNVGVDIRDAILSWISPRR